MQKANAYLRSVKPLPYGFHCADLFQNRTKKHWLHGKNGLCTFQVHNWNMLFLERVQITVYITIVTLHVWKHDAKIKIFVCCVRQRTVFKGILNNLTHTTRLETNDSCSEVFLTDKSLCCQLAILVLAPSMMQFGLHTR